MKYEITKEELDAIQTYKNERYININQLLANDVETDIILSKR